MKHELNIGKKITSPQIRDAIHIAIAPVIAAHKLTAGRNIGLDKNGKASIKVSKFIGIVDPFLLESINEGEQFWMFLYPNTITSLNHVWSHPSFDSQEVAKPVSEAEESKFWIAKYAENKCDGLDYQTLMDAAEDYEKHGEYLCQGGRFEGMGVSDEFWDHYEKVVGRKVEEKNRGSVFTCSC